MRKSNFWQWTIVSMIAFLALVVLQVGTQVAGAAARAMPTPVPIATVDLSRLLGMLDERVALETSLEAEFKVMQAEIDTKVRLVESADKTLEVAPPDQVEARSIELLRAAAEVKLSKEIAEQLMSRKTHRSQLDLFNKIKAASASYAQSEGYAVVFSDDSAMDIPKNLSGAALQAAILSQRIVYIDANAVDITEYVADQMNATFRTK